MRLLLTLFLFTLSASSFADCSRYYIIYIENQTDGDIEFEYNEKDFTLRMDHLKTIQRIDLKTIMGNARTPVPNKCRFFITGKDLIKTNGESNLTRIYTKIANDGTEAPLDVFTLTHGDTDGEIEVLKQMNKYESLPADEALLHDIPEKLRPRLGIFHNSACYGLSTNLMGTKAGFAASIGSDDETLGPLVLRDFLKHYLNGLTLKESAQEILNSCVHDRVWRETVRYGIGEEEADIEKYCNEAIIAIVGNADITVNDNINDLRVLKQEHLERMKKYGQMMDGRYGEDLLYKNYNPQNSVVFRPMQAQKNNPLHIKAVEYRQQFGDRPVGQVDINFENLRVFKYVSIDNLNFSKKGIIGGQVSAFNDGTVQAGVIKRDYAKGILFQVNIISLKKAFFVTGGDNGKGFKWQYVLSGKSNLGYLLLKGKDGQKKSFAHIGAKLDSELNLQYKRVSLETNTGWDFMLLHPTSSPFYSNGSLNYNFKRSQSKIGGYADYNSFTGFNAGVTATIDLDIFRKKKRKARRRR